MKNWRTTVSGILAAVGEILPYLGVPKEVASAIQVIATFFLGFYAKDYKVTGIGS